MSDELNLEEENFEGNNPGFEEHYGVPSGVNKLNWGAFLWPFIWGLFNVKFTKVLLVFIINILIIAPVFFISFSGLGSDPSNTPLAMLAVVLLILSPIINLIIMIIFLIKGNKWSWNDKHWESEEQFISVQKKWTTGIVLCWLVTTVLSALIPFVVGISALSFLGSNISTKFTPQDITQALQNNGDVGNFIDDTYSSGNFPNVSQDLDNSSSIALAASSDTGKEPTAVSPNSVEQNKSLESSHKPINSKDIIDNNDKVVITIGGHGRENPFKPFYDRAFNGDFPPPDDVFDIDETAKKLLSIKVAGILYDPFKPTNASAIVKVSDSDYMVKKGDVVAGFSILDINKTRVYVKYGSNTYNASIGETIIPDLKNNSGIDNINKKFAGNTR